MSDNPVVYWELASHDSEATVAFLEAVFDWQANWDDRIGLYDFPSHEAAERFAGGGVFTLRKAKLPFLTIYIRVDDIDTKEKLVKENGGYIVEPVQEIPGGAKVCLFNEPSGVALAMIQPAPKEGS